MKCNQQSSPRVGFGTAFVSYVNERLSSDGANVISAREMSNLEMDLKVTDLIFRWDMPFTESKSHLLTEPQRD